jgi:hypothetical protein
VFWSGRFRLRPLKPCAPEAAHPGSRAPWKPRTGYAALLKAAPGDRGF